MILFILFGTLVRDIKELLVHIPHVDIQYTFCEDNMIVDFLSNLNLNFQNGFVHFDSPPSFLSPILLEDIISVSYIRCK